MGRLKTQIFSKKASAIMHASIWYMHDNIKKKKKKKIYLFNDCRFKSLSKIHAFHKRLQVQCSTVSNLMVNKLGEW